MADNTASSSSSSSKSYSLVGKNLKLTTEQDIQPYIDEIDKINGLEEIHLGGNTLGVGACQALGKALEKQKSLKVADFADIFTGRLISEIPDALRALCDSLVGHTSLVEMNLSDNAFGGRSAEPMVNFITHNHHFSVLKLNNNGLGVTGGQIVANALLAAAEELDKQGKPSQLKTVICGRNRLEDGSAPYWAKAYAAHKTLEEVRMFQNGIRMDGIIALAQGLAACPNLKVFDIQDNTATTRGSRGIAAALPQWPNLETLNLSDCLLKPKGGAAIVQSLSKGSNTALKTLQLQYCDLDRKVLDRIGSAIGEGALKNIEKLEINGNWADEDDECIEKIKKALEKNGHADALDELDEMDPEGEEEEDDDDDQEEPENGDEVKSKGAGTGAAVAAGVGAATAGVAAASIVHDKSTGEEATHVSDAAAKEPAAIPEASSKEKVDEKSGWASKAESDTSTAKPEDAKTMTTDKADEKKAIAAGSGAAAAAVAGVGAAGFATASSSREEAASGPTSATDKQTATDAAEVAQSAQEVPEEKEAASNAAEVAQSAQEVPEEKEAASNAAEVADSALQVPESKGDASAVKSNERHEAAGAGAGPAARGEATAAAVTSANAKPAQSSQTEEDKLTAAMAKSTIEDNQASQNLATSDSMDLSGELYGKDGKQASSATAGSSAAAARDAQASTQGVEPGKKKKGFRAALGAVRELLK